ncbi:RNA-directed DNA polymerase from mobile element jockey [Smittium culicis]|uniref:RNA-directed DNA polymerase from mobile element jockey n=1 Tax=Smittium culicis TaxID=133412 RepID=A0A1R1X253_9FUNG|nr:RNA-directed DNA polymerase from mobile element jockey [Smittium culicis]
MYLDNKPRHLWRWLKYKSNRFNSSIIDGPLFDNERQVINDKNEKANIWAKHFEELAKDFSGNSRKSTKWESMGVSQVMYFEECDNTITWKDITKALKSTPNNKAAGKDRIPSEFWKLVEEESFPTTNLAKLFYKLIKNIWDSAYVPEIFNTSIVIPIPKKGDRRDPNNYKGISLMPSIIKIVTKIASHRLAEMDLKHNLLIKEQAGFRTREECVSQATVLYEAVRRRKIKSLPTWIGFIDFAKAFDRVPHQALLYKLKKLNIGGHLHKVISALYKNPKIQIRFGNALSETVEYECGVRQGCPASPMLFDLFINDILEAIKGVYIPELEGNIRGLLFADDAVVLAESPAELQIAFEKISQWSKKWEMKVNASKCGAIGIGQSTNMIFTVQGGIVPQVEEYKYLGIMFNKRWNHVSAIKNNTDNARKALNGMYYFLARKKIPIALRTIIIRSVLLPIATYGGEIFGMSQARNNKIQSILDTATRLVLGAGKTAAITRIREELRITPVNTKTAISRERAYYKWHKSRTWISDLIEFPMKSKLATWVSGTQRWIKRFCSENSPGETLKALTLRTRKKDSTMISNWIESNNIGRVRNIIGLEMLFPEHSKGIMQIIKIRTGTYNFAYKLARSQVIGREYLMKCPFCNEIKPESVEHLIFECSKWTSERREYMGDFLPNKNNLLPGSTDTQLLGKLLGGELIYKTVDILKNVDYPAVKAVLATASFLSATLTTRTITLNELIGAPASWTQSRNGMETLVGRDGIG